MPAKSNASPAKPVSLLPAGALLFLAAANAVLVFWLRELLSKDGVIRLLLVLATAPAAGAGSIVLLSGCVYGFGNLVSSRRRLTGIPIRWSRVFPAVCRFHVYLGLALTLLSMAALWFLPGQAAPCFPLSVLPAPVPFLSVLLLRRWDGGPAVPYSAEHTEVSAMRFVVATHNRKKREELSRILSVLDIVAVTGEEVGVSLTEPEETGTTFEENAWIKAAAACRETGLPAVADDSGLMVDALDGAPGVYSARYAGEGANDADRNAKLLEALREVPEERRTARFVSAICCAFPDGSQVTARGECPGRIAYAPRGDDGFGYDPLFIVADGLPGAGRTFAELTGEEKDAISHRGNALREFSAALRDKLGL